MHIGVICLIDIWEEHFIWERIEGVNTRGLLVDEVGSRISRWPRVARVKICNIGHFHSFHTRISDEMDFTQNGRSWLLQVWYTEFCVPCSRSRTTHNVLIRSQCTLSTRGSYQVALVGAGVLLLIYTPLAIALHVVLF